MRPLPRFTHVSRDGSGWVAGCDLCQLTMRARTEVEVRGICRAHAEFDAHVHRLVAYEDAEQDQVAIARAMARGEAA